MTKRITFTIPEDEAKLLEELAEKQSVTQTEALRRAIATESYFFNARQEGVKVLTLLPEGDVREIVFR